MGRPYVPWRPLERAMELRILHFLGHSPCFLTKNCSPKTTCPIFPIIKSGEVDPVRFFVWPLYTRWMNFLNTKFRWSYHLARCQSWSLGTICWSSRGRATGTCRWVGFEVCFPSHVPLLLWVFICCLWYFSSMPLVYLSTARKINRIKKKGPKFWVCVLYIYIYICF